MDSKILIFVVIASMAILPMLNANRITYKSCSEAPAQSGIYWISLGAGTIPLQVFCEQEQYAGGWLVVQNRIDGSTSFNRSWNDYKYGFGDFRKNFWLGLEKVHQLTISTNYDLMIVMENYLDFMAFQKYEDFVVDSESEEYSLSLSGNNVGTAGDSLFIYNSEKFSAYDRDNSKGDANCAAEMGGGFWHYDCRRVLATRSNLNGIYDTDHVIRNGSGVWWGEFGGIGKPLKKTRMMMRVRETANH